MFKAIIFDIYGTLLKRDTGDLEDVASKKVLLLDSFSKIREKYKLDISTENLCDLFIASIGKVHERKKAKGIKHPEVMIENIWGMILDKVGYDIKGNRKSFLRKIVLEHDALTSKKALYPNTTKVLTKLKEKGVHLGIVSNAQFYTEMDMNKLLKKDGIDSLYDLFDKDSVVWSYKLGEAKPSLKLFDVIKRKFNKIGIKPVEVLYVGNDMLNDIKTAKAAGLKTCLFINEDLKLRGLKIKPDYKIKELKQLFEIIDIDRKKAMHIAFDKVKQPSLFSKRNFRDYIMPVLDKIISLYDVHNTKLIAVQGGQGTGKTKYCNFLKECLINLGFRVTAFSIDDFYETKAKREKLSRNLKDNPFYQIPRGMPGTHRYKLLNSTIRKIKRGRSFELPIFDKSFSHGYGEVLKRTTKINQRQDFVFFEGWCVGLPYVSAGKLLQICNNNKINIKKVDSHLEYSKTVLGFARKYQTIWKMIDCFIMIKFRDVSSHHKWRHIQEIGLKKTKGRGMTKDKIFHFVDIYTPFTYLCYDMIRPDIKIIKDEMHHFIGMRFLNN